MKRNVGKFVFWAPRVLAILFIAFLALFSLDVFDEGLGFWQVAIGLLVHNIPVFILIAVLVVAWKYEIVGAIVFFLAGLAYIFLACQRTDNWLWTLTWGIEISGPAILIGGLFLANWIKRKKIGKI